MRLPEHLARNYSVWQSNYTRRVRFSKPQEKVVRVTQADLQAQWKRDREMLNLSVKHRVSKLSSYSNIVIYVQARAEENNQHASLHEMDHPNQNYKIAVHPRMSYR